MFVLLQLIVQTYGVLRVACHIVNKCFLKIGFNKSEVISLGQISVT
jgi:hypothetical protein